MIRNYVDGFGVSYKEDKSEFLLDFVQLEPMIDDNNADDVSMKEEMVAKLKFNREVAEKIYATFKDIFERE